MDAPAAKAEHVLQNRLKCIFCSGNRLIGFDIRTSYDAHIYMLCVFLRVPLRKTEAATKTC